jgi:uncharacterized protein (TIGR00369 family)
VRGSLADPSILGLNGLERMRASLRRMMAPPPIHHLTGMAPVDASPGACTFSQPATPWLQSAAGWFAAGAMALPADAALAGAIVTTLEPGRALTTSDLSLNFFRGASVASGRLVARARVVHVGRTVGLAESTIEDGDGRLLGFATTRCFLFDMVMPPPHPPALTPFTPPAQETPDPYLRPVVGSPVPQEEWSRRKGIEVIRDIVAGVLPQPPFGNLFGLRVVEFEDGSVTGVLPASGWLCNVAGMLYGGALALAVDAGLSLAVQTTLPADTIYSPLDLKVNFLRPVFPDGTDLVIKARVIHRGRSLAVASAEMLTAEGKRAAVALGSMLILPGRKWAAEVVVEDEARGE